jgi:hypothetical protein
VSCVRIAVFNTVKWASRMIREVTPRSEVAEHRTSMNVATAVSKTKLMITSMFVTYLYVIPQNEGGFVIQNIRNGGNTGTLNT